MNTFCSQAAPEHDVAPDVAVVSAAMTALLRGGGGGAGHEVEARLGTIDPESGRFVAGVEARWFEMLLKRMQLYQQWDHNHDWQESEDVFFTVAGRNVRQSRIFDANECTTQILTTVEKRVICKGILEMPQSCSPVAVGANAIRFAYATEEVVKEALPEIVIAPLHVRYKQRRSFEITSTGIPGAAWRFDFTRIWSGQNHAEAEIKQQRGDEPVCEIEVEWIPPPQQLFKQGDAHFKELVENVAASLRTKVLKLLE